MGKRPYTRICDRCGQRKPWRRGYHTPGDDPPKFICADCCTDAGGVWGSKAGWRFPVPESAGAQDRYPL